MFLFGLKALSLFFIMQGQQQCGVMITWPDAQFHVDTCGGMCVFDHNCNGDVMKTQWLHNTLFNTFAR